ncbi:unnamed protein product [Brassica oleracea]
MVILEPFEVQNCTGALGFVLIDIIRCPSQFCNCRSYCIITTILVLLWCS